MLHERARLGANRIGVLKQGRKNNLTATFHLRQRLANKQESSIEVGLKSWQHCHQGPIRVLKREINKLEREENFKKETVARSLGKCLLTKFTQTASAVKTSYITHSKYIRTPVIKYYSVDRYHLHYTYKTSWIKMILQQECYAPSFFIGRHLNTY